MLQVSNVPKIIQEIVWRRGVKQSTLAHLTWSINHHNRVP